jgi:hypothetical protein
MKEFIAEDAVMRATWSASQGPEQNGQQPDGRLATTLP